MSRQIVVPRLQQKTTKPLLLALCAAPHTWTTTTEPAAVEAAVAQSAAKMSTSCVDMVQLHWWQYDHPGYLDAGESLIHLTSASSNYSVHPPSAAVATAHMRADKQFAGLW